MEYYAYSEFPKFLKQSEFYKKRFVKEQDDYERFNREYQSQKEKYYQKNSTKIKYAFLFPLRPLGKLPNPFFKLSPKVRIIFLVAILSVADNVFSHTLFWYIGAYEILGMVLFIILLNLRIVNIANNYPSSQEDIAIRRNVWDSLTNQGINHKLWSPNQYANYDEAVKGYLNDFNKFEPEKQKKIILEFIRGTHISKEIYFPELFSVAFKDELISFRNFQARHQFELDIIREGLATEKISFDDWTKISNKVISTFKSMKRLNNNLSFSKAVLFVSGKLYFYNQQIFLQHKLDYYQKIVDANTKNHYHSLPDSNEQRTQPTQDNQQMKNNKRVNELQNQKNRLLNDKEDIQHQIDQFNDYVVQNGHQDYMGGQINNELPDLQYQLGKVNDQLVSINNEINNL